MPTSLSSALSGASSSPAALALGGGTGPSASQLDVFEKQLGNALEAVVTCAADAELVHSLVPLLDQLVVLVVWRPTATPERQTGLKCD